MPSTQNCNASVRYGVVGEAEHFDSARATRAARHKRPDLPAQEEIPFESVCNIIPFDLADERSRRTAA